MIMGYFDQFQRFTVLCLFLLAAGSLITIVFLHSQRIEFGQWLFLTPCIVITAISAWLFVRAGAA